ncbi:lariat debranching enzyme [Rhodotorula kratochvilovae]
MAAPAPRSLRIATVGCSHGTLDDIYASVARCDAEARARGEQEVDLVLCCGDFQAMRNTSDLETMACPVKYRALGHFHQYYSGAKKAPKLTIVIGGNHEASGYMWECYHGGWLAPDIYFLGFAGSVLVDGWLRIAGASGIWKGGDWKKGHYETVPYDDRTIRSVYHIREYDVARLLQLKNRGEKVDVFLSHDWPLGIEQHGDTNTLLREKPFFRDEVVTNSLGSPPLHALLTSLQPRYWFSAHLHVKFAALFHHDGRPTVVLPRNGGRQRAPQATQQPLQAGKENPDEIVLDEEEEEGGAGERSVDGPQSEEKGCAGDCSAPAHAHGGQAAPAANPDEIALDDDEVEQGGEDVEMKVVDVAAPDREKKAEEKEKEVEPELELDLSKSTRFLALSKPGRGRDFLQILDVPATSTSPSAAPSAPTPAELPTTTGAPPSSDVAAAAEVTTDSDAVAADTANPASPRPKLFFDPHWLAIVRATAPYLSLTPRPTPFPPLAELSAKIEADYAWVKENVGGSGDGMVEVDEVMRFARTAPTQEEWEQQGMARMPSWYTNPQTLAFSALLGIKNRINPIPEGYLAALEAEKARALAAAKAEALAEVDAAGEQVDEEPAGETAAQVVQKGEDVPAGQQENPEEIAVDDDEE